MAGLFDFIDNGGQPPVDNWFTNLGSGLQKLGNGFQQSFQTPLVQAGIGLAMGGPDGMYKGIQASHGFADQARKQQMMPMETALKQAQLAGAKREAEMHPLAMDYKKAQTEKLRREAAEAGSGFAKEIRPYQTLDGRVWGVQAGANGDRLMHDLSNPMSPPIYVPRGRNLPAGQPLADQRETAAAAGPLMSQSGAPVPTRTVHPPPIASAGPSAGMPPSQETGNPAPAKPVGGLFDDNRYVAPAAAEPATGASSPTPAPQAAGPQAPAPVQAPSGRTAPGPLTPFRGVKQVGKHMVDTATGRIVGDVEDSLRGGKFVEEDAKLAVADIKDRNDAIQASRSKLPRLEIMANLIDRPEVYQGTGANSVLELKKAAQTI